MGGSATQRGDGRSWPDESGAGGQGAEMGEDLTPAAEADLIDGVRDGDPEAMAALYERHRDEALRFAVSLMSDRHDAEDVLHEAFVKTVNALRNGYGPSENFGAYLSTSVRSAASTVWMKQARERPVLAEDMDQGVAHDPGLERVLSVFELEDIAAAMRALPVRWRTVLWHAEVMGHPPRVIAPIMGIEPNAVSALLIRARAGLRAAYEVHSTPAAKTVGGNEPR
jgi:RNA polymerase sigma factor (sigma-70 family)